MRIIGSSTSLISSWTPATHRWLIGKANDVYRVITTNYAFSGDVIKIIWRTIVRLVLFSPSYVYYSYSIVLFEFFFVFKLFDFYFFRCRFLIYFSLPSWFSFWIHFVHFCLICIYLTSSCFRCRWIFVYTEILGYIVDVKLIFKPLFRLVLQRRTSPPRSVTRL